MNKITIRGFSEHGNWYKGNLHSHTVNSDGMLTPEESVKMFREHGYQFLCFSEHDLYTDYRENLTARILLSFPDSKPRRCSMKEMVLLDEEKRFIISMGFLGQKK